MRVAAAARNKLAVFKLSSTPARSNTSEESRLLGTSAFTLDTVTALLWVGWDPQHLPSCQASSSTCLLVGTAAGYVQLHDSNGDVLLRQRLHTGGPVQRLQLRSHTMGECAPAAVLACHGRVLRLHAMGECTRMLWVSAALACHK